MEGEKYSLKIPAQKEHGQVHTPSSNICQKGFISS
jgi:hypothetical protein